MRALLPLVLAVAVGCGRGGPQAADAGAARAPSRPASTLAVTDVRILDPDGDERIEPRFGRGEKLRLALAPHPVTGPLAAVVRVVRPDGTALHQEPPQRATRGEATNAPWTVPFALPLGAPSGPYRVEATLTDVRGQRAVARARFDYVSADEPAAAPASAPAAPPASSSAAAPVAPSPPGRRARPAAGRPAVAGVRLLDAAALPRTRFARSEQARLEVEVDGARPGDALRLRLVGPEGRYEEREGVVPPDVGAPAAGVTTVRQPLRIPPYGAPGHYRLEATLRRGDAVVASRTADLAVVGRPLPVPERLEIEASEVAGATGRRVAVIEGGRARVRVRLAGYVVRAEGSESRVAVSATAALRLSDGRVVSKALAVGKLDEALAYRPGRIELQTELQLPRVPSGDFLLELEAHDALAGRRVTALRHVSIP